MTSLIPFENRHEPGATQAAHDGPSAPIVDVSTHSGRLRNGTRPDRRRARRNWDPAFHVDLLTF